ncbi:hypothetical protein MKW98_011425 [Papaver atlanticum]|uniref:RNA-dependent RNA polymerase n=1 Tax=Papaver atlanticum TaxID=357466 RepID=A0AAD4SI76_9MAGN|nr:hypothetical protein MKW98_011425 [Papaver atlanticum]
MQLLDLCLAHLPSMIKIESDPKFANDELMINSFEVVSTSMKPKRTNLLKYLVAFLSYGGVPDEYFLAQTHSIKSVSMDDFILANMWNSLGRPFLRERLSMFMREGLKSLKYPMNDSLSDGTADPSGVLKLDQV